MTTAPLPPGPPPLPTPTPPPSRPQNHSTEAHAARVGARATVVGATIGVAAALIGALATGYFDASSTDKQIDAQAQQSQVQRDAEATQERKSSARAQLQAAAATLISDSTLANRMEIDLFNTITPPDPDLSSAKYDDQNDKLVDQFAKLSSDVANIRVLGHQRTNDFASKLLAHHGSIADQMTNGDEVIKSPDFDTDTPEFSAAIDKVSAEIDEFDSVQNALISAVQADLQ